MQKFAECVSTYYKKTARSEQTMNPGQEKFLSFMVERVREDKQEYVKELLNDNFRKQQEGTFNMEDMQDTQAKLMEVLKPEAVEEVKAAMSHFASQMK